MVRPEQKFLYHHRHQSLPSFRTINQMNAEKRAALAADLQKRFRSKHTMGDFANPLMRGINVLKYDEGNSNNPASMIFSFHVTQNLCNSFDTLHGGAQATAVDIFTSIALHQANPVPSVTADLHVSYVSSAPIGSTVICVCKAHKPSGALQFSSCDLYRKVEETDGKNRRFLVAKGLHTKYVLKQRVKGFHGGNRRSKL